MGKNRREIGFGENTPDIIIPNHETPDMGESEEKPEIKPEDEGPVEIGPELEEITKEKKTPPSLPPEAIREIIDRINEDEDPERDKLVDDIIRKIHDRKHPNNKEKGETMH